MASAKSVNTRAARTTKSARRHLVPIDLAAFETRDSATLRVGERDVALTNLQKPFWPELGLRKIDLLRHYLTMAPVLLPHLADRAMVMKRYPNGWSRPFFFMKRSPAGAPTWLKTCSIEHGSGSVIDFPIIDDAAALAWVVNLGCIDLNPWYARCDDVDRPDYLHFDLDPGQASFDRVREIALILRDALGGLGMPSVVKTSGSKGLHVYVPIDRGPTQKQVWTIGKTIAFEIAARYPALATAEYTIAKRPKGRVLIDYNQNAWGRTLASVYSVRPTPRASVSMPVEWSEVSRGIAIDDFRIDNAAARIAQVGDLFAPVLPKARGRFDLGRFT